LKGYNLFQKKILHRGGICYLNIGTDFCCQESRGGEALGFPPVNCGNDRCGSGNDKRRSGNDKCAGGLSFLKLVLDLIGE
jgi:hypothetical protein